MPQRFRDWTDNERLTPAIKRRIAVEQKIARFTVKTFLDAGFSISVDNGEEIVVKRSRDAVTICDAMNSTDEEHLFIYEDGAKGRLGWVFFVYGNDGWDVISDYTTSLEPQMELVNKYAEEYA